MYNYIASANSHWGIFLKSNKYLQIIKDQMSGHKILDVNIWMLTRLLFLHLCFPGFIKHCQSLHTHPVASSPSKEKWDFIASSTWQGIYMRSLVDRYIQKHTHTHTIYLFLSFIHAKRKMTTQRQQYRKYTSQTSFHSGVHYLMDLFLSEWSISTEVQLLFSLNIISYSKVFLE